MIAIIFIVGITIGAMGSILLKIGAGHLGHIEIGSFQQMIQFVFRLLTDLTALAGMTMYFLSGLIWSYLLTKLDISFVQPILALTYVATPILAIVLLGEHVPLLRWVGIAVIVLGVVIVARTSGA